MNYRIIISVSVSVSIVISLLLLVSCTSPPEQVKISQRRRNAAAAITRKQLINMYKQLEKDGYGKIDPASGNFIWIKQKRF